MSSFDRTILGGIIAIVMHVCALDTSAAETPDAPACSKWLADHPASAMQSTYRRDCVLAVASTYIDAEENSLPAESQILADDVSRHRIGTAPSFQPGNRAKLVADMRHEVIGAIRNRRWTIEGDEAWILYDGYLKKDPDKIGFYVAERITLEKGLIKEILVADITLPK
jgi:hypothetical protein